MLDDFSEGTLADAIHENFHSLLRLMCRDTPGFEWVELEEAALMVCDAPVSIYNRVVNTRFHTAEIGSKIEEIVDFYSSRGLPFLWMVGPRDSPPDLWRRLEEYGFAKSGSPGMAMDLNQLKEPVSPPGFRMERVQDRGGLETFSELMPQAFEFTGLTKEVVTRWIRSTGIDTSLRHYLGYLDGRPVATSSVFLADGVAGLYCVGTMPEARGRGIGSALSATPLLEAREEGFRVSILHSSMMAHRVYLGLGFRDCDEVANYSIASSTDPYLHILSRRPP